MKITEIKSALEAKKEEAFAPIDVDGVKPVDELDGLELVQLDGVNDPALFLVADVAYRAAGIRTSRLVQSDPRKEIGGLIAYLLGDGRNPRQRREWLRTYVLVVNRLVQLENETGICSGVVDAVRDLRAESAEDVAYRLLKDARGNVANALEAAKKEGREIPKWVFNRALERLTAEIFARMA